MTVPFGLPSIMSMKLTVWLLVPVLMPARVTAAAAVMSPDRAVDTKLLPVKPPVALEIRACVMITAKPDGPRVKLPVFGPVVKLANVPTEVVVADVVTSWFAAMLNSLLRADDPPMNESIADARLPIAVAPSRTRSLLVG